MAAFARLTGEIPHNLVLIGSTGWNADEIFATMDKLELQDRLIRPGFVPHMKLRAFYSAADAFVFPTFYEGFGLPLLEAITCGCPVATSPTSSVPEVVGEHAVFADPEDIEAIAQAVRDVLEDTTRRDTLIAGGKEYAKRFSWHSCAETTLAAYRSVL